jgi:hypothetical protein
MPHTLKRAVTHQLDASGNYLDPQVYACQEVERILKEYHPEPLEPAKQRELTRLLDAADREIAHSIPPTE